MIAITVVINYKTVNFSIACNHLVIILRRVLVSCNGVEDLGWYYWSSYFMHELSYLSKEGNVNHCCFYPLKFIMKIMFSLNID